MADNTPIKGITVTIDTDTESVQKMVLFTDMPDEALTDFVLDYPVAMAEWIRRLRKAEADKSDSE
jgi:hypothetical protein